jgi:hypothetical protein
LPVGIGRACRAFGLEPPTLLFESIAAGIHTCARQIAPGALFI